MRILLATAVAIAPLMAASGAMAEVVISTNRTTPITTSNATGTGPDSIRIASGGAISIASGVAVAIDSSNGLDIDSGGSITLGNSASGSIGVLVNGGNTASISIGGSVVVGDDILADTDVDTDNDGDIDGAFANGTGRYGVRIAGAAPLVGNVIVEPTGVVVVDGNQSFGLSVEAPLTGSLDVQGLVTITGTDSYGIRTTGPISGDVRVAGVVTARGQNSIGAAIDGDVGGGVSIGSTVTASGYRYTTRPQDRPEGFQETSGNDEGLLLLDELDADDLLQGGPAIRIAGNVAEGVVIEAPPVYSRLGIEGDDDGDGVRNGDEDDDGDGSVNRNDADRDGDGIPDAAEGVGGANSFGAAPAVSIGAVDRSIVVGVAGVGDNAYGFINRGNLTGQGVYDGVTANALTVGGNAGQTVTIDGGIRNIGTIATLGREADATTVRLGAGATTPVLVNSGTISVGVAAETTASTGTAILIEAGANVSSLVNSGTIQATAGGGISDTVAVRDLSGSLTSITNSRSIQANVNPNDAGDPVTGTTTAIDVSANTTGVTILQTGLIDGDDDGATATTDPDADGDGVDDGDEPSIFGAIQLGSGADTLDVRNGVVVGDISFGAGADNLSISGGATVSGALSDSDGALSVDVSNGTLSAQNSAPLNLSSLNVGADGNLIIALDPAAGGGGSAGTFNVSGAATLADGAGLGVRFNSLLQEPAPGEFTRFTLIDAGTLDVGQINPDSLEANSPYLYVVQAGTDAAAGQVFADVRRRSADEAGFIPVEAQFYDSFYSALGGEEADALRDVFLSQTGRDDFINLYEQLLPDHSGGPLLSLASGVDAVTRALTGRNASAAPGETSAWVQEINFYADKDKTDTYGFRSEGFGVAGGVERGTGLGAVGLSVAFTSSDLEDPESEAEEVLSANLLELGLYWRAQGQRWTTWARGAAGYASFESERRLVGQGLNLSNQSDWNGFSLSAAAGASYEHTFGRFSLRPEAYVEYFGLSEDGHVEEGGGDGFDLEIDDRDGHLFAATAAVNLGMSMGQDSWLKPEVRVGWRQNISVDPGETIARFRSGGPDFTLSPDTIEGGGPILGLRLNIGNELGMLSISADAEMIEDYVRYMLFLRASFRF